MLWDLAENSKRELSEHETVEIDLEVIAGIPMVYGLTRHRFNELVTPLIERSLEICGEVLKEAETGTHLIDGVVLVGGTTRVPAVREAVRRYFRREPDTGIDPDLVVSVGAAIYGASLSDQSRAQQILLDVTPLTLRLGTVKFRSHSPAPPSRPSVHGRSSPVVINKYVAIRMTGRIQMQSSALGRCLRHLNKRLEDKSSRLDLRSLA